jgi:hypothetical protein
VDHSKSQKAQNKSRATCQEKEFYKVHFEPFCTFAKCGLMGEVEPPRSFMEAASCKTGMLGHYNHLPQLDNFHWQQPLE